MSCERKRELSSEEKESASSESLLDEGESRKNDVTYTCLLNKETPTKLNLIRQSKEHEKASGDGVKREDFEKTLSNAENGDSNEISTRGQGKEKVINSFKAFPESEDLTRELQERLRKRKKGILNSGEPSNKSARCGNSSSAGDGLTVQIGSAVSPTSSDQVSSSQDVTQCRTAADIVDVEDFIPNMGNNSFLVEQEAESVPLQDVVEKLLNQPDQLDATAIDNLKKGLCFRFFKNSPCVQVPCKFEHIARTLFHKKLKGVPSSFIVLVMVAMKDDPFFPDVLLEGFGILKSRQNSVRFLPLVSFFAFYVTNPRDGAFFTFWSTAANHFSESLSSSDIEDGYAHLLKIFRQVDQSRQSKVVEFLSMLKNPAMNCRMNWKLLEPVISMKVPPQFLIEAVESCNRCKTNVHEVHDQIISRILVKDLPIEGVEVLLQFCEILRETGELDKAVVLKARLRSKVQSFKLCVDKRLHPQTYFYFHEMKLNEKNPVDEDEINEEEEERKVENVLKEDEERLNERPPPPPNCYMNPMYFMHHKSLPRQWENRKRPGRSILKRNKKKISEKCVSYPALIQQTVKEIQLSQFTAVGKALNYFHINNVSSAAKEIFETILQTQIEPSEVVNFLQTVALNCESKNSSMIIASVALTMMVYFLRMFDWDTAYTIYKTCDENEIVLKAGEVFLGTEKERMYFDSPLRKVLLLVETCLNSDKLEDAYQLIEKNDLLSSGDDPKENQMKAKLINTFMDKIIDYELTELVHSIFVKISKAQGTINDEIDFREYANDFLILLFNNNKIVGLNCYKNLLPYNCLKETTMRTVAVELLGLSKISEAESLMQSHFHTVYKLPIINGEPMSVTLPTNWTKEEMFLVLDLFLDKLTRYFADNDVKKDTYSVHVFFQEVLKDALPKEVRITPKCLNNEDCSLSGAKRKFDEVIKNEAFLFLQAFGSGNQLTIEPHSLVKHLEHRSYSRIV